MFLLYKRGFRELPSAPRPFTSPRATAVQRGERERERLHSSHQDLRQKTKQKTEHPLRNALPHRSLLTSATLPALTLLLYHCVTPHQLFLSPSSQHLALPGTALHQEGETQQGETPLAQREQQNPRSLTGLGSDSRLWICHYTRASGSASSICST